MYFKNGDRFLFYSDKLKLVDGQHVAGEPLTTLWDDILSNNLHKEGGVDFPKGKKPELLIKRCLELSTAPGDWVLDSFAGSGTTGAVAHKMRRRWIMVELGEHCHTHIIPRLRRTIDGTDDGVVAEGAGWKGGGGFRYYRLAPSLLEKDSFGNWVISKEFNPSMLAEAICKLEGFQYAPSENNYWQHGHATETDFIYVTTQTLSREQLARLSEEVGDKRSLLVMCSAFRARSLDAFTNLTIKKIPKTVLTRCEWGKDDYSLEIKNLPAPVPEPSVDVPPPANNRAARKAKAKRDHPTLFDKE
jgi:adenine-specific DNA-methyltransferase